MKRKPQAGCGRVDSGRNEPSNLFSDCAIITYIAIYKTKCRIFQPAIAGWEFMQDTGIKTVVIEEIISLARRYGLQQVILFGSRARGDYWRASDIDLAVQGGDAAAFAAAVEEETSTLLQFDVVDLSLPLQERFLAAIKKEGIILYEKA